MEYYYTETGNIDEQNSSLIFKGSAHRHLGKVLRKKKGDELTATDGNLNIYKCIIENITSEKIFCKIISKSYDLNEPEQNVTICVSQLRNQDRFEIAVEKSVELGVKNIIPVITEHTVAKTPFNKFRLERLRKIIISATEQSQRCYLPEIQNSVSFDELMKQAKGKKIAMYEFAEPKAKLFSYNSKETLYLFIGPEGGFSDREVDIMKSEGWELKSLGQRKVRAETAVILALNKILNY